MNKTVIDKKLNYISSKLDASSARSPATFDPDSFSEQEKILFAKVGEILGKNTSGVYPYRVPLEDAELVNKACKIVVCSAMELFTFVIPRWFGGGEVNTWFFDQYFCNFMFDYMECLKTVYKRSEKEREDFLRYLRE